MTRPPKQRPPEEYWRDDEHDYLRVSLLDAGGSVIREVGQWRVEAPLNKNTSAPVTIQVELLHADDCGRVIQRTHLNCY